MDGLLIDSEPLWQEAGMETLAGFGKTLTAAQYHRTTGLRTEEWIEYWLSYFEISPEHIPAATQQIIQKAIEKISAKGTMMPGVRYILDFFTERNIPLGLASSSPMELIDVVVEKLGIGKYFHTFTSAQHLPFGKPHPQVYIDCAAALQVSPLHCLAFEDSFNGMIAAKAARMKCVVVPAAADVAHGKWNAADMKLGSLLEFDEECLRQLSQ